MRSVETNVCIREFERPVFEQPSLQQIDVIAFNVVALNKTEAVAVICPCLGLWNAAANKPATLTHLIRSSSR
jgi:hypothetical protein